MVDPPKCFHDALRWLQYPACLTWSGSRSVLRRQWGTGVARLVTFSYWPLKLDLPDGGLAFAHAGVELGKLLDRPAVTKLGRKPAGPCAQCHPPGVGIARRQHVVQLGKLHT